jgi:hypothetical protein
MTRIAAALGGATVVLALVAAPAAAAPRYVSPTGASGAPCSAAMPCDIETGVEGASTGDEVLVAPGNYGTPESPEKDMISSVADIDVHGIEGQPRPMLYSNASQAFSLSNPSATLTHFGLVSSDASGGAALALIGALADRVYVSAGPNAGTEACILAGGATLRNSVCSGKGFAIEVSGAATLQGVTAWSIGTFSYGLEVFQANVTVQSSILQGSSADVRSSTLPAGTPPQVTLSYSNYDSTEPNAGTITPPGTGTNQVAAPALVNPAMGDFHQFTTSPTVDKGAPGPPAVIGAFDIDGGSRATGAAPDIGADEIGPESPTPAGPGGGGPGGSPGGGDGNGNGTLDRSAPTVRVLPFSPMAFLSHPTGPSVLAPSAVRGTRVRYELSERAHVAFRAERAAPGRRVGRRCRRPTRRNAGRRRCVRWVRVRGGFTHAGLAGANSFRFSGRVGGRALRPGRHRLVATPVDVAGNRGKLARRGFRILRRR